LKTVFRFVFLIISGLYINFEQPLLVVSEGNDILVQIVVDHPAGTNFTVTVFVSVVNAVGMCLHLDFKMFYHSFIQPQTTFYHVLM